ncbi:MAG: PfkB family carbohydrate kinase, partial [Gemmatimonadota bacterium]|nr:PfkB family carbohydrate kinase [Gemmatimonadota bacterium]
LGREAYENVSALGLETTYLQWDDSNTTGTVKVSFDEQNNPDYVIIPHVAYDHIQATDSFLEIAAAADCIYFGTLSQRFDRSRKTLKLLLERSPASLKFCDINLRKKCYTRETVVFSLEEADVLKMNEQEARGLARILDISQQSIPRFCEEILNRYSLRYCLVTLAEKGAFVLSGNGEKIYVPGYNIELEDSLGAGDAFSAGFIHEILRGATVAEACGLGNIMGALVAAQRGATSGVAQEEMNRLIKDDTERNVHPEFE